jgi:hypothetical protein
MFVYEDASCHLVVSVAPDHVLRPRGKWKIMLTVVVQG